MHFQLHWVQWVAPGTGRNWALLARSLQENPRSAGQVPPALLILLRAAPGTWAGQEGQGTFTDGQGSHKWHFLLGEGDKSFFISNLEFICCEFIAFEQLEGRISCFVLFLHSVSLILVCPFVFWKWKEAEETQILCFICWVQAFSHSHSLAGCPLFQGNNGIEATLDSFPAACRVLNTRNVINQRFWSSNPRHIIFSRKEGLLLMDEILVGIFGL